MKLPIDLATVDWVQVGTLTAIAFIASLVATIISFGNRSIGPVLTAILFAVFYVAWFYYLDDIVAAALHKPA